MVRGLSWSVIGLLAMTAVARADGSDDSEIIGRVFERVLTRAEFNERLAFLTRHLDARAEPDQLWRRLALLESAARRNLQVSPAAQRREEEAVIRQASIAARLRERWPETPKSAPELEAYEAESLRLQRELRVDETDRKNYFESRKLSPEDFSIFIREQLTLTALRQLAAADWKLDERAFEKAGARWGSIEIEIFSLEMSALPELKAEPVSEATLRATYERDPLRFRRPREVAVEGIKRVDDGDLRRVAEIREALVGGAELSHFVQEPRVTKIQQPRRPLDNSPENDWMGTEAIRDFCQRAPVGELSPVLRQGGFQWLLRITEARPAGRASFAEARAGVEAEWLAQARMGALLERANAWLRDLKPSWSFVTGPGRKNLGRHRLSADAPRGDWPSLLRGRALELGRGETALCPDLPQRRVLLFKVLEIHPPDRAAIPKESLSKVREPLERRAAAEWQARLALEARRIGPEVIEYSSQLLAPATVFVLRQMSLSEEDWSPTIARAFEAGEGLEAIASRLGRREEPLRLELFEKRSPLTALGLALRRGRSRRPDSSRRGPSYHYDCAARATRLRRRSRCGSLAGGLSCHAPVSGGLCGH
jgi:hypothetical protein